ncbi:UDP-N-acetylglucosamine 2-epimerase (non-hydrolyzing) [Gammaproteobacteria bacterium]|nr:UDP-N-acetylglucosamine 2-epimerase (non-hydrolyzing) [Gammaproteobacteria bacterium]
MSKLKIITVVGTRPEIIRLATVIPMLDRHCDHILVHTGQNYDYELNKIFFDDLEIREPNYFLDCAGATGSETIGNVIISVEKILIQENPEALLVLGDTNSCMSVIAAKRHKIPTFHMEAGNRCFDMRVPEEINRRIADHTADINLTYSSIAREYLLREGISPDTVIKTGSPMYEVLSHYKEKIDKSKILSTLSLKKQNYFVVSAHREENIDSSKNFLDLVEILNSVAENYQLPIVVSTHPRTMNKIKELDISFHEKVHLMKPLSFSDYNNLQINAIAVLSDSGTINEEASILKFSALNIREAHERPEGMEEGSVMMVGLSKDRVLQGLKILETQQNGEEPTLRSVYDYSMPNVSEKVVRLIHSYTDYVNRVIWKKY